MLATAPKTGSQPNPSATWKRIVEGVEPFLGAVALRLSSQVDSFEPEIAEYARYALTAQGKQLRPTLVALSAEATGKWTDAHVTAAVIIEMVHLATLVHDDVMDEAEIRRGQPTVAQRWGNEISVLLGDCLFAQALKLAASFPTTEICRAVSSATKTVCSGEILQTQQRGNFQITRETYYRVLSMKTAELFALSCDLGGFLSGATPEHRSALRRYGMALGTAYQLYDDGLDLFGSEKIAGKSLGTDLAKGKVTLPVLVALERAGQEERDDLVALLGKGDGTAWASLMKSLSRHDCLSETQRAIGSHLGEARRHLQALQPSQGQTALEHLTEFLASLSAALESPA